MAPGSQDPEAGERAERLSSSVWPADNSQTFHRTPGGASERDWTVKRIIQLF